MYRAPLRSEEGRRSVTPSPFASQDRTVRYFVIMILSPSGPDFPVCRIPVSYCGNYTMPDPAVSSRGGENRSSSAVELIPELIPLGNLLRRLYCHKKIFFRFFKTSCNSEGKVVKCFLMEKYSRGRRGVTRNPGAFVPRRFSKIHVPLGPTGNRTCGGPDVR